ncbi:hypothetical protein BDY21DRAFT_96215 [Lineolata rhizophorae]|uniref:Uncharacterized protein n=1 Tax=Lineolata rhizophorae TaxID=578093 RepID=A0A6A6NSV1_9PEZI|nr:hypothetical protein BDY21DRAFT_96215 [Lineolata rhizophorae]
MWPPPPPPPPPPPTGFIPPPPNPQHRVTELSEEPAAFLAGHLADWLANALTMPLNAVLYRCVATTYLATPAGSFVVDAGGAADAATGAAAGAVRPLGWGLWMPGLGLGGLRAGERWKLRQLVGKVALCCAIELLVIFGVWGVEWVVVTGLGRKWFGWGKLGREKKLKKATARGEDVD